MASFPKIISVDDHVIEPPHLWDRWLPAAYRDRGPKVERHPCDHMGYVGGVFSFEVGEDGSGGTPCDWWRFEDKLIPRTRVESAVGFPRELVTVTPITYEDMLPGCFDPAARLVDMDAAGIEVQLCFPSSFVRFCGQTFSEATDRDLGLACVRAYNDWMVEEWCGDSGGRLVPLAIVPLRDAHLAAEELRRVRAKGVKAVTFSEIPAYLGLPSIHSGEWDPFFAACDELGISLHIHIGSSSKMPSTSADAPPLVASALTFGNAMSSLVDYLLSGVLVRFPNLKIAYSEGQIGWLPYVLERTDKVWEHNRGWGGVADQIPEKPSTYFHRQVYGCFFDDDHGLSTDALAAIGKDRLLYETDYPHSDSTWPDCRIVAEKQMGHLDDATITQIVRGNAIELLELDLTP